MEKTRNVPQKYVLLMKQFLQKRKTSNFRAFYKNKIIQLWFIIIGFRRFVNQIQIGQKL